MAGNVTLRLTSRGKPIRKLPATIEVPAEATVEAVKKTVARQSGIKDFNRIGFYVPGTKTTLKDRNAVLAEQEAVLSAGELQVKDLGPQISWRLVYFIEYIGPILIHALIVAARPHIYRFEPFLYKNEQESGMTLVQWVIFGLFQLHFVKREIETIFVHKFTANTMPVFNVFRNSGHYWGLAGVLSALDIYAPGSWSARRELSPLDYFGIALYFVSEICNGVVHLHLASLRPKGSTAKGIPNCIGSSWVSSPNYMFEFYAWVGVLLISRSPGVLVYLAVAAYYLGSWSRLREKALRQTFGDKYKKKRYTMLPGIF